MKHCGYNHISNIDGKNCKRNIRRLKSKAKFDSTRIQCLAMPEVWIYNLLEYLWMVCRIVLRSPCIDVWDDAGYRDVRCKMAET